MPSPRSSIDHGYVAGELKPTDAPYIPDFPAVITARNKLAALCRYHPDNTEAIEEARRVLTEAKLAVHVKEALAAAPPMSERQIERISRLLRGGVM